MSRTKIAIAGALGRMGNNLINSALSNNNVELVGVFDVKDIDPSFINKNQIQENVFTTREESFEKAADINVLSGCHIKVYDIIDALTND